MKNYFMAYYNVDCIYSPNWYGQLNYSPMATVLMYVDDAFYAYCIGYMEANDANVNYISEKEAMDIIDNEDGRLDHIWKGERLAHRWDIEEVGEIDG